MIRNEYIALRCIFTVPIYETSAWEWAIICRSHIGTGPIIIIFAFASHSDQCLLLRT